MRDPGGQHRRHDPPGHQERAPHVDVEDAVPLGQGDVQEVGELTPATLARPMTGGRLASTRAMAASTESRTRRQHGGDGRT